MKFHAYASDWPPHSVVEGKVEEHQEHEIWIKSDDDPHAIAQNISDVIESKNQVWVAAIGPSSVNQAVKSIAIARKKRFDAAREDLTCVPYFSTIIDNEGEERTRMVFYVFAVSDA